tara:strand:+ start:2167 stop:2640 length:474 start_codon:yes stop_codon:yes gene_type:complete
MRKKKKPNTKNRSESRPENANERIKIPQKDFDNLKRRLEEMVVGNGGYFADKSGSKNSSISVKSSYHLNKETGIYHWHSSYSANSSYRNAVSDVRRIRTKLGIEKPQNRSDETLQMVQRVGSLTESMLLDDLYARFEDACNHILMLAENMPDDTSLE